MNKTSVKKVLKTAGIFLLVMIVVLGVHIYMVTRPKAPTAQTVAMARIDLSTDINNEDAAKITSWLYEQKGVDHVLCNENANLVVFTFHPLIANADIIANRLINTLHYTGHRYVPSEAEMKGGCPVAATSVTYKVYGFFKNIF